MQGIDSASLCSLASRCDKYVYRTGPPGYICWLNRSLESIPRLLNRLQIWALCFITATMFKDDIENLLFLSLCVWILQNSDWSEYGSAACQLFFVLHRGRFSYISYIIEALLTLLLSLFDYRFFIGSRIFPQTGIFLRYSILI